MMKFLLSIVLVINQEREVSRLGMGVVEGKEFETLAQVDYRMDHSTTSFQLLLVLPIQRLVIIVASCPFSFVLLKKVVGYTETVKYIIVCQSEFCLLE